MERVLILSDSHGLTNEITQIKGRHQCEHVIHCGDSELEPDHPALKNMTTVKGNCDFAAKLKYIENLEVGAIQFFITHGHLYDVGINLHSLHKSAKENGAQVVCYGHTHVAGAEIMDGILFINPGSIRLPRRRNEKSYAIMEWEDQDEIHIHFYTTSGEEIADLAYRTSLDKS